MRNYMDLEHRYIAKNLFEPKLLLLIRREESHTLEKNLREGLIGFIMEEIRAYE